MKKKAVFKIQGKRFVVSVDLDRMDHFQVNSVPKPYNVHWDTNANPGEVISQFMAENPNNLMLIDEKVYFLYRQQLLKVREDKIFKAKATETFKTIRGVLKVVDFLQTHQITKGEKLIVVGGGIIQDVGGFVGACYKRGIPWIYFPTTLLSMCDSCIGGKIGINYRNAKNQLALFSAPSRVVINSNFLKTLDNFTINSGLGEILKLHVTGGPEFMINYTKYIKRGKPINWAAYKPLILGALSVKRAIVEADEFELNYRRGLNYGHTIGHAVEVLSHYKIPHGQAVTIGMLVVNELAARRGIFSSHQNKELKKLSFDLLDNKVCKIMGSLGTKGLKGLLKKDKKTLGNEVNLVTIKSIGDMRFLRLRLDQDLQNEISKIMRDLF